MMRVYIARTHKNSMNAKDFETLALSLRPGLVKAASQIVVSEAEAEDLAQDTMLKLWSMREKLTEYRSVEALARIIIRRLALNAVRQHHGAISLEDAAELSDAESPDTELERNENAAHVDAVFAALPEAQQILIRLRHVEGYDNAAIAAVLGTSEGAVRTALSRARRRVAQILTQPV